MEVKKLPFLQNYGIPYQFSKFKNEINNMVTVYMATDGSNCKLSYLHELGVLVNLTDENKKQVIDYLLNDCKGVVFINTTQPKVAQFIAKTYPVYFYSELPIGYYGKYQYHLCIQNIIRPNGHCRNPVVKKVDTLDKVDLKTKLNALLKTKKRKADYVDEFINSL